MRIPYEGVRVAARQQPSANAFLPSFKALLVDAAGTLLLPSEPSAGVYLRYARKYCDIQLTEAEVLDRFRQAYNAPYQRSFIRYVGDARPFWSDIVAASTGCHDPDFLEEVYAYFAHGDAWRVADGALESLTRIRASGTKLGLVSNFDTRLRPILRELGLDNVFDAVLISAEIGAEKPNPCIFEAACEELGVQPAEAVHVGDDRRNDLFGARRAGCYAWLWGQDVSSFADVEQRLSTGNFMDSLTGV